MSIEYTLKSGIIFQERWIKEDVYLQVSKRASSWKTRARSCKQLCTNILHPTDRTRALCIIRSAYETNYYCVFARIDQRLFRNINLKRSGRSFRNKCAFSRLWEFSARSRGVQPPVIDSISLFKRTTLPTVWKIKKKKIPFDANFLRRKTNVRLSICSPSASDANLAIKFIQLKFQRGRILFHRLRRVCCFRKMANAFHTSYIYMYSTFGGRIALSGRRMIRFYFK